MDLANQRKVYALALPIMLSNATVPLVGIVDTAVIGRMDSPAFMSAVAVGAVLFSSIFWVFGFLKMATGGLVAQALGRTDTQALQAIFARAVVIALSLAALILILGAPLLAAGLWAMGGSDELHGLTGDYFLIRLLGAPATLLTYVVLGTLIGQQRMKHVFWLQLVLNLLNVALNLLFFQLTDWHVKGVAFATILSEYIALALGLYFVKPLWQLPLTRWKAALKNTEAFVHFFTISTDIFIRTVCLTFAFYWITALSSRFGDTTLALNAILLQMLHFASYALDGFAIAVETLAGNALGQRNRKALIRDVKACAWGAAGMAILFSLAYGLFGQWVVNSMTTIPDVRTLAPTYLFWIVIGPLVGVWSFLFDGIYIGTTQTKEMRNGMLISIVVFILSAELLVAPLGNHGLWLSYHLFMVARAITLGAWFPRIVKAADQPLS